MRIENLSRISLQWLAGLGRAYSLAILFIAVHFGSRTLFEPATTAYPHWWDRAGTLAIIVIVLAITFVVKIAIAILPVAPLSIAALALALQTMGTEKRPAHMGRWAAALVLLALAALASWYLYDYCVPDYRWLDDDTPPWQHGLTCPRFAAAFGIQALIFGLALWSFREIMRAGRRVIGRK